jgi:hypothetical protein
MEERHVRVSKNEIPVKIEAPGAIARQQRDFGDASEYGPMGGEHFSMARGTDLAPLLQGLEDDLCHAPHWGYLIDGALTVTYKNGTTEEVRTGDLFFWPPGHTVRIGENAEFVLFSPQREHTPVLDHVRSKVRDQG